MPENERERTGALGPADLEEQAALELPERQALSLLGGSLLGGGGSLLGGTPTTTTPAATPTTPDATQTASNASGLAHHAGTVPPSATTQPYNPSQTRTAG